MNKLKENVGKLLEKIKSLSKGKKIAFGTLALGILIVLIYLIIHFNKTNYAVLFRDMDPNDAQTALAKLNEKKIQYKIENNTIKVPEEKAAELRMEIAPVLTNGAKGYEILDEGSKWGMTDKEMDTKYQIALQGELQKTIETFPEVEKADVKLVMNKESDFFKKEDPAQASVTLHFKNGQKVNKEQIKAIVSLIGGSVKNLPKENVKVIGVVNGTTSVLSEDLFDDEKNTLGTATDKQRDYEKNLEKEYEKKILALLSQKYGAGVQATVDVQAEFDASEKTSTTWDKTPVVRSEKNVKDTNTNTATKPSGSPVDNNMSNTYGSNGGNSNSSHEESTKNYEIGKVEEKVVAAPGKIKKVSASIIVNESSLSDDAKTKIQNTVSAAIGYDQNRGDIISVEGMKFAGVDDPEKEAEKKAQEEAAQKKMLMYKYIGAGVAALIALIAVLIFVRKSRKKRNEEDETQGIDFLVGENVTPKEPLKPIEFDDENEKTHLEKEIKKYASNKPEQVAEIIKAWMAEDER
ncbi:flagellar basal-body MS-ring/collar protein FliF [Clostridium sp. MB40-C1]|uniref:flagellar basal-body MS-ring/collar protein FliF n=1 Tax=Clostridium sp. MB40-C1 TaxID=3070996 RepID=UPI0027E144B8|nr:flagellar basal-body MS-ring/collar protein FliF [Clostridium sp. MB40-C1]WMJ81333.1 flagellar basal-body MS-ring/collar protein FliF [Clostridium sp. MB40-C1]